MLLAIILSFITSSIFWIVIFVVYLLIKKSIHGLFILNDSDPNTTRWILDVKMDPEEIKNMKEIRLKVCKMDEGDV